MDTKTLCDFKHRKSGLDNAASDKCQRFPCRKVLRCIFAALSPLSVSQTKSSPDLGCKAGRFGLDDTDIAVFRFTLGIPGFDDALIPRIVGAVGAAGLLLNHIFGTAHPSMAQVLPSSVSCVLRVLRLYSMKPGCLS